MRLKFFLLVILVGPSIFILSQLGIDGIREKFTTEYYNFRLCNHSFKVSNSQISIGGGSKRKYVLAPGTCRSLRVEENTNILVNGAKFSIEDDHAAAKFTQPGFKHISLAEAAETYKRIGGIKRYKAMVADRSFIETPFTLGLRFKSRSSNEIHEAIPGMPGYDAGIEAGDKIIAMDRTRIRTLGDYAAFMNSISLKRTSLLRVKVKKANGQIIEGKIQPDFFKENHPHFRKGGASSAFWSHLIDGLTLGLISEGDPGFKRKLDLDSQIYSGESGVGILGSFLVPGAGAAKAAKLGSKASKAKKVRNAARTGRATRPLNKRRRNVLDRLKSKHRPFAR